jgi:hypothetical protein
VSRLPGPEKPVPSQTVTSSTLRPRIEECGYVGDRIAPNYSFGPGSVAIAGFIGKPWDARSACLAVVDATTDSRLSAQRCIEFGAPTVLVCRGDSLDWWQLSIAGPRDPRSVRAADVDGFFRAHGEQLKPENIYAAKLRRPVSGHVQMEFVDAGLMPALERKAGEALNRLVTQAIRALMNDLGEKTRSHEQGIYKSVFWMLAAKLLKEKGVRGFRSLDLEDVSAVFEVVGKHYKDARDYPPGDRTWKPALTRIAATIARWGSLGNISAESLAYLYETSMIDAHRNGRWQNSDRLLPDVRKTLGIHSTPTILVDHILSQLWPLVDGDKLADQRVYEPACGHAAFLTAAMRDLRNWSGMDDSPERHRYLRERIRGIEIDPFAVEIAKLSLTLADEPHGNAWEIEHGDMFRPGVLRDAASWATMVLSNPPYEDFKKTGANRYRRSAEPVTAQTKAVEMLKRVVPSLSPGSVFGFVLPQGTLYDREAKRLRQEMLRSCEIAEISLFEDKLFSIADHETCILLGRRKTEGARVSTIMYRRVRNKDMHEFKSSLAFSREDAIAATELGRGADASFYEPDLREVWRVLAPLSVLGEAFDVQKGYEFHSVEVLKTLGLLSASPRSGWLPVALKASDDYKVWELPIAGWLKFGPSTYRARGGGVSPGRPQVVINYSGPREPWRFRPVVDPQGVAISSRFLAIRPKRASGHSLLSLWAVMLSPVANAYAYSWSGKRQTLVKEWEAMPLPKPTPARVAEIETAATAYLELAVPPQAFTLTQPDESEIRQALFDLDAAVLRLYDLPPDLERQLLAIFDQVERPGVGCTFLGYPRGWSSRFKQTPTRRSLVGFAKGMFEMRSDFNEPLEEFAEYQ